MSLHIVSWDVKSLRSRVAGIGGKRKLYLRKELQASMLGPVDVLLLQNHHIEDASVRKFGKILPGQSHTYWEPSKGENSRSSGVCISVGARYLNNVCDHGTLVPGRAMWIALQIGDTQVGILNVYAPSDLRLRCAFWHTLAHALPDMDAWIIGGDFNNLESCEDQIGKPSDFAGIAKKERKSWESFLLATHGRDVWHETAFQRLSGSLDFSWGFRRRSEVRLLERLDRFYIDEWGIDKGGQCGILAGTTFSDHAPVTLFLEDPSQFCSRRSCRVPDKIYSSPEARDAILSIWDREWLDSEEVAEVVASLLVESSHVCQRLALESRRRVFLEERASRRSLASLQFLQQHRPHDPSLEENELRARAALSSVLESRAEFSFHSSASFRTTKGDGMNKEFFVTHGQYRVGDQIRALTDSDGEVRSSQEDVMRIATEFYQSLFASMMHTEDTMGDRQGVSLSIPIIVTDAMRDDLIVPFTEEELTQAFRSLCSQRCPGEDGLSKAFFSAFWEELRKPLLLAFQRIFASGRMPQSLVSGIICLIPKGGDKVQLSEWTSITILPTAYKGLAKMISARIRPLLPDLIHKSQLRFVLDHSILDNILTFFEFVGWAQHMSQPLAVLLVDLEKVYDRVDWSCLEGTLTRFGFPPQWITGVSALYQSTNSRMIIDGKMGDSFILERLVRQGCPLASYLFLFYAEAMSYFLRDEEVGIKGFSYLSLQDAECADDTALYVDHHVNRFSDAE